MLILHKAVLAANSFTGPIKPILLRFILTKCVRGSTPQLQSVIFWRWQSDEMLLQHRVEGSTGTLVCGPQ